MYEKWENPKIEEGYDIRLINGKIQVEVWSSFYRDNLRMTEEQMELLVDAYRRFKLAKDNKQE
jgi:hypothetical protein